jgi:membrane AbrB-like protein
MDQPTERTTLTLRATPSVLKWSVLLAASLAIIAPLQLIHLPAALLLGAMAAAILVAVFEGKLAVPHWPYVLAQGLIGCLVARSIGPAILVTMIRQWPLFLVGVCSVLVVSTSLGALLARWKVLPGTTAVWGSAPGAATVMVLMSEVFGGDSRLVAFMQFLRVMLVALVASIVARLWVTPAAAASAPVGPRANNGADHREGDCLPHMLRCPHHHAAAVVDGGLLCSGRMVDRIAIHARDRALRRTRSVEGRRLYHHPHCALRRFGVAAPPHGRYRPPYRLLWYQPRRR